MTIETRRIPVTRFSAETFARYGACIAADEAGVSSEGRHFEGELAGGARATEIRYRRWETTPLEFTLKPPTASVVRYFQRGFTCTTLERHPGESQMFVPIGGRASILAVAAPDPTAALPDPATFKGFLLEGDRGFVLHRYTWVRHVYPIGDWCDLVVVTGRDLPDDDVENVDLEQQLGLRFEFVLDSPPPRG